MIGTCLHPADVIGHFVRSLRRLCLHIHASTQEQESTEAERTHYKPEKHHYLSHVVYSDQLPSNVECSRQGTHLFAPF
jgi:hypothetical protein